MAIIKCKMCGGDIILNEDKTYGTCDSCGSTMTFPKVSDEQRANLFNRANHFRRLNEFDKAIAAYERILEQDDADAEAHWGSVISRYGIEYVEDPKTHERIPTCHRVQSTSILTDADYLAALSYAPDAASKAIYEKEAQRIAEIQKDILAISSKEEPYDVFICYKETTEGGSRTKDSTLAQEVYYQLTQDGYKVFFSRITLEDKLGTAYEPYIFAALNSAKVMVVVGTKAEHFNAVWVKNEWSRYLDLMHKDKSRLLIPCYRDMDAYDLPEELSMLQSQDMSRIGFMQDLIRGIKKVLEDGNPTDGSGAAKQSAPGVESLYKRTTLFLEDGDFVQANEYADRILDIDPEFAPAYIVKLCIDLNVNSEGKLAELCRPISDNANYKKALRFANDSLKAVYEGYNAAIENNIAEAKRQKAAADLSEKYDQFCVSMKRAASEGDFDSLAKKFAAFGKYKDAENLAKQCAEKAAKLAEERKQREEKAAKDAELRRLESKRKQEKERIEKEKRRKRNRKATGIVIALALVVAVFAAGYVFVLKPKLDRQATYSSALAHIESHDLDTAKNELQSVGEYEEAPQLIEKIDSYQTADKLYTDGSVFEASVAFKELGDFLDSADRYGAYAGEVYDYGVQCAAYGNMQTAYDVFVSLGDYSDSAEQVKAIEDAYAEADAFESNGQYAEAAAAFAVLNDYSDSATRVAELDKRFAYDDGMTALTNGEYAKAAEYFSAAADYSDAADQLATVQRYLDACALQDAENITDARNAFASLGNYADSADRYAACAQIEYDQANALIESGDVAAAHAIFADLGEYGDSADRAAQIESSYQTALTDESEGRYADAISAYEKLCNYEDAAAHITPARYAYAKQLWEQGNKSEAEAQFTQIEDYEDVSDCLVALRTELANAAYESGDYDGALAYYIELPQTDELKALEYTLAQSAYDKGNYGAATQAYEVLGQYELASSKLPVARYAYADQLFAAQDYLAAAEQFTLLGDTSDAAARVQESMYQYGKQLLADAQYISAKTVFADLQNYSDSKDMIHECDYQNACGLMQQGYYLTAEVLFESLGSYSDCV